MYTKEIQTEAVEHDDYTPPEAEISPGKAQSSKDEPVGNGVDSRGPEHALDCEVPDHREGNCNLHVSDGFRSYTL